MAILCKDTSIRMMAFQMMLILCCLLQLYLF
uniref:Uncharacterized protein n=1 Tax=Arundo donax TaxID=35708 RepID=A0A0A9H7A1_ARUDO